jgi:monoamine oxidase
MKSGKSVIGIVGAGVSGLATGILLLHSGQEIQIFESRSFSGGRIQSRMLNGYLIEAGPEFIHGNAHETMKLLKKYNISFVQTNGKMYTSRGGHLRDTCDMMEGWDNLLDAMEKLKKDSPFGEFILKYFPGETNKELRNSATRFAEGFDLVDIQTASTKALAAEWIAEESAQYRIPEGYHCLVRAMEKEFLSAGGKILFQHTVESVDWGSKEIRLGVNGHRSFNLDKLVVSVPICMLNYSAENFEALSFNPFPQEQLDSFAQVGYGTVVKLVMSWKSAFWKTLIPHAQFLFTDGFIPTWWTQYPQDLPLLTGWLGGPSAESVSQEPDEFFLKHGFESLSAAFSIPVPELKNLMADFRVFNWKKENWSRGAYSYATVKSQQAKILSMRSLERRVYFAGEAFYEGSHPGTVESALVSGLETGRQLLAEI